MKRLKILGHIIICSLVLLGFVFSQPIAHAEDSLGDSVDCTDVSIYYVDDPNLTPEERLRLMDKAFLESLNKFDLCQSAKDQASSPDAAASNGDGAEGAAEGSAGETGGMAASESVASSTMSGTEPVSTENPDEGLKGTEQEDLQGSRDQNESGGNTVENMNSSNGKAPDDIPPARNDDTLAAQIRYAAETETDPEKKKLLWNEYRKYKGLPTR